jgi:serine/threonine protein kinase
MDALRSIGRYELIRRLGSGSMGDVYEAHDPKIDRRVAIKVLRRDLIERGGDQAQCTERFLQEARAAGRLLHPNIITLHDYGDEAGTPFLAMEFVQGENLNVLLKRHGRLALSDALTVITQVLRALDFAHSCGVIHRDVKPSNIMLTENRLAKIADFGIAHIETSDLTTAGDVLGTPSYMAPEQLSGKTVDNRTDLFAVGAVLFELLGGAKPFGNNFAESWFNMERRGPADILALNPGVTPALKTVIETALAFDPDRRYASAMAFARAIAEAEAISGPSTGIAAAGEETLTAAVVVASQPLRPAATTGSPPFSWDILDQMERDLTGFIGPIARTLVRRSASTIPDLTALCERLATYIVDAGDRASFLSKCEQRNSRSLPRGGDGPSGAALTAAGSAREPLTPATSIALAPDTLRRLEAALTEYIGPIARIVLRKQLLKSSSLADLYGDLAVHIPNDRDRAAFLKSQRGG